MSKLSETLDKLYKLKKIGQSNAKIERDVGISKGYLTHIFNRKHKLSRKLSLKVDAYYNKIIKELVGEL